MSSGMYFNVNSNVDAMGVSLDRELDLVLTPQNVEISVGTTIGVGTVQARVQRP